MGVRTQNCMLAPESTYQFLLIGRKFVSMVPVKDPLFKKVPRTSKSDPDW